jgi:hypothetical protein
LAIPDTPGAVAVTVYEPVVAFAVKGAEALPFESVVTVTVLAPPANVPLASGRFEVGDVGGGAVKVTLTPLVGDPPVVTVACSAVANAVLTVASCGDPAVALIVGRTTTAVLVRLKSAVPVAPVDVAVTVYEPGLPLAVNAVEVAMPLETVVSMSVVVPFAKVPLAPDDGAVKVTVTPLVPVVPVRTVAWRLAPNGALTVVVCGVPPVALIVGPLVALLVRLKLAVPDAPEAVAVTEYEPAVAFAVNAAEVAMPFEPVVSVSVVVPLAKVPLAPDDGAVKVTVTPLVPELPVVTVACNAVTNCVLMVVLWGVPAVAAIDSTGGGVVVELELPQLGKKLRVKQIRMRTLP